MTGPTSPATRLHDVVVVNDQTGALWRAPVAAIRSGLIVVTGLPPHGFFDNAANTFTIRADDGGNRKRCFPSVTLDRDATRPPKEFAFT